MVVLKDYLTNPIKQQEYLNIPFYKFRNEVG